jgi:hypothetical protein
MTTYCLGLYLVYLQDPLGVFVMSHHQVSILSHFLQSSMFNVYDLIILQKRLPGVVFIVRKGSRSNGPNKIIRLFWPETDKWLYENLTKQKEDVGA